MTKAYYEQSISYHLPTMELKRNAILGYLESLIQSNEECHGRMTFKGYFRSELLEKEIAYTMGWVREVAGRLHGEPQIILDMNQYGKIQQTIQNMAKKGHIKLSKSGRGFKILDTWRA